MATESLLLPCCLGGPAQRGHGSETLGPAVVLTHPCCLFVHGPSFPSHLYPTRSWSGQVCISVLRQMVLPYFITIKQDSISYGHTVPFLLRCDCVDLYFCLKINRWST
ncbi:hypothetical protein AAFF_G00117580, partial [Aldrovandia affinis]